MSAESKFNWAVADMICELIAEGNSLTSICKLDNMPHFTTVMRWLNSDDPEKMQFRKNFELARFIQADYLFEECLEIADDASEDVVYDRYGNPKENREFVNRSKVRILTRLQYIGLVNAKKYGKKAQEAETGDKDKLNELIAVLKNGPVTNTTEPAK